DSAVVVVIASDDGARLFKLNFVESNVDGHVFPSVGSQIAEEAGFAFAIFGDADGRKINPAVVVVVNGDDAVSTDPIDFRQRNLLETFRLLVLPEGDARRAPVGEGEVHPAIVVEIEDGHSKSRPGYSISPWDALERPLSGIFENHRRLAR